MSACGIAGRPRVASSGGDGGDEHAAARYRACRLVRGVLALLEEHAATFTGLLPEWEARSLSDGGLRRYLDSVLPRDR
jgi:hypothetical protein